MNVLAMMGCLRCEGGLSVTNVGKILAGREGSVVLACDECKFEHHLRVVLAPLYGDLDTSMPSHARAAVCGTESGYTKHRRNGEDPCQPCRDAHSERERGRNMARKVAV